MLGKIVPSYGKNGIPGCYLCRVWTRGNTFIITANDITGKELTWRATDDSAEVGNIVKYFYGN